MRKKIWLMLLCVVLIVSGCTAPLSTELSVDRGFSGTRVMSCAIPAKNLHATGLTAQELMEKYCPEELVCRIGQEENGMVPLTFTLSFSSQQEYLNKVEALLNEGVLRDPEYRRLPSVVYSTPDTILTSGCRLSENFTSADLLQWLIDAIDSASGKPSNLIFEFTRNEVITDGGRAVAVPKYINLDSLAAEQVDSIGIETVQQEQADVFSRTVRVTFPRRTVEALGSALEEFLAQGLPSGARAVWEEGEATKTYAATFQKGTIDQLERDTRQFFRSDQISIQQTQLTEYSTFTRDERTIEETIDLSGFFSPENGATQVTYTFRTNDSTQLTQGLVYNTSEWMDSDKVSDDSVFTYHGSENIVRLSLTLTQTHLVDSIAVLMEQNNDGTFRREMDVNFDREKSAGGAAWCARYFNEIATTSARAEVISRGEMETCRLSMRGTPQQLTAICEKLFGEGNAVLFTEAQTAVSLKNYLIFRDDIALSGQLREENNPTPLEYTLKLSGSHRFLELSYTDEYGKTRTVQVNEQEPTVFTFRTGNADSQISYDGSRYNVWGTILLSLLTAVAAAALVALFLFILRRGRDPYFEDEAGVIAAGREIELYERKAREKKEAAKNEKEQK